MSSWGDDDSVLNIMALIVTMDLHRGDAGVYVTRMGSG